MSTDPPPSAAVPVFTGSGEIAGRSWWRSEHEEIAYRPPSQPGAPRILPPGHPAAYEASKELVAAVDTALLLRKPLIVTGKPGTGKTELAERIAYELDLGPVLRFEAQSLSEANDLFYRFDHIAQLIAAKLVETNRGDPEDADVMNFVQFGPLGKAILRSMPGLEDTLVAEAREMTARRFASVTGSMGGSVLPSPAPKGACDDGAEPAQATRPQADKPKRSVVLIDEIDKASRDFPNDLLNGIDRMDFRLRELGSRHVRGAGRDSDLHPIVVVTSNSERDLPPPFMRRCVYAHIKDPSREQLAAIVRKRVFGDASAAPPDGSDGLPPLYSRLLTAFVDLRDDKNAPLRYAIGTSELLDIAIAARRRGIDGSDTSPTVVQDLKQFIGALAKDEKDAERVEERLTFLAST